jgi:hypothetical protein
MGKLDYIRDFFNAAESRVHFLNELIAAGHKTEAMILCLVYIDQFAQVLCWPSTALGGQNFVTALIRFGKDPFMRLVHPLQAIRSCEGTKQLKHVATQLAKRFPGPSYELMTVTRFETVLTQLGTDAEFEKLRPEIWRATLANIVYEWLRNPIIHGFKTGGVSFPEATYNGQNVPELKTPKLINCVKGLIAEARRRSEAKGQFFGNDAMFG